MHLEALDWDFFFRSMGGMEYLGSVDGLAGGL